MRKAQAVVLRYGMELLASLQLPLAKITQAMKGWNDKRWFAS
jgi:hypothetical protein